LSKFYSRISERRRISED